MAQTYFGARFYCDPRDSIQATIIHFGTWEPNVSRLFERIISPGDLVVDMGANVGYYSVLLSKLVGPRGEVVAVEPVAHLADEITRNADLNDVSNIRVVRAAVSDRAGLLELYEAPPTNSGMSTTRSDRGFPSAGTIQALPITDILSPAELQRVSLIKCDIEGSEIPVMKHILDNLELFSARLMIEVEASTTDNPEWPSVFDRFLKSGFRAYRIPNRLVTLWEKLLNNTAEAPWYEVFELPAGEPDILFSRVTIPEDRGA